MKTIKISFVDFWPQWNPQDNFIVNVLKKYYNVIICDQPEYIFFSNFGGQIQHFKYNNCIKIFYTPENLCPDFNLTDYAISFEYIDFGDRHLRYPNFMTKPKYKEAWEKMRIKHLVDQEYALNRKFCSYVVSNGKANKIREEFFEKLSKYKTVDSGGRYKNNIGIPMGVSDKRKFDSDHKFSITFENTSHPGYTTEKLIEGFAANLIPIYWGDPLIHHIFNKKAFIDVNSFKTSDEVIEYIKLVDNDDNLYLSILREPALLISDIWEQYEKQLDAFLRNIFEQPFRMAFRRNREFWGSIYNEKQMIGSCFYNYFIDNRIIRGIKKMIK